MGEGSLVRFVGLVLKADHANFKKNGEAVNCNHKGRPWNDVHIAFVEKSTIKDDCKSVTAQISPHFRPDDWTPGALKDLKELQKPVRITGASLLRRVTRTMPRQREAQPKAASVWEVHPVYGIEVCSSDSLSACKVSDNSKWKDLDAWLDEHTEEMPDE